MSLNPSSLKSLVIIKYGEVPTLRDETKDKRTVTIVQQNRNTINTCSNYVIVTITIEIPGTSL